MSSVCNARTFSALTLAALVHGAALGWTFFAASADIVEHAMAAAAIAMSVRFIQIANVRRS